MKKKDTISKNCLVLKEYLTKIMSLQYIVGTHMDHNALYVCRDPHISKQDLIAISSARDTKKKNCSTNSDPPLAQLAQKMMCVRL